MSKFTGTLVNKRAYFDYEVLQKFEAGIKLLGCEVKAIKEGRGNLTGTYVKFKDGEAWLIGLDIPPYSKSGVMMNYKPDRTRKLLLRRNEIINLERKVEAQGLTVAPLKLYIDKGLIKVQIGLTKGKKQADKKADLIQKQQEIEARRDLKLKNS